MSVKKNIVICTLTYFFALCLLYIAFGVTNSKTFNPVIHPTEYEATVVKVEQNKNNCCITVEEFPYQLHVDTSVLIGKNIEEMVLPGEKVYYQLRDIKVPMLSMPELENIQVDTLRTENQYILTTEDFYRTYERTMMKIRIGVILHSIPLVTIGTINLVKIIKIKKANKQQKER